VNVRNFGVIKPDYDPRLTNEDLAPLREQTWSSYSFFASRGPVRTAGPVET
jgi:cytosine/uracil/thiamine/allantoin permease